MSYRASRFHTSVEQDEILQPLYEGLFATREAVKTRGLSVDSDEAICLSTILNLDLKPITDAAEDKRMVALWSQIPKLPLSLVFSRAPSKLPIAGFHWAPSSFRGRIPNDIDDWWCGPGHLQGEIEAEQTSEGLLVSLPGLYLQSVKCKTGWSTAIDMGANHIFQLTPTRWFSLSIEMPWNPISTPFQPETCEEKLALILSRDILGADKPDFYTHDLIANQWQSTGLIEGLLARIVRTENETSFVSGLHHAQILELDSSFGDLFSAAVRGAQELWELELSEAECIKACLKTARKFLLDPKLMKICKQNRIAAGLDENEEEVGFMVGGMIHNVFKGGFNTIETVTEGHRWCVD